MQTATGEPSCIPNEWHNHTAREKKKKLIKVPMELNSWSLCPQPTKKRTLQTDLKLLL